VRVGETPAGVFGGVKLMQGIKGFKQRRRHRDRVARFFQRLTRASFRDRQESFFVEPPDLNHFGDRHGGEMFVGKLIFEKIFFVFVETNDQPLIIYVKGKGLRKPSFADEDDVIGARVEVGSQKRSYEFFHPSTNTIRLAGRFKTSIGTVMNIDHSA